MAHIKTYDLNICNRRRVHFTCGGFSKAKNKGSCKQLIIFRFDRTKGQSALAAQLGRLPLGLSQCKKGKKSGESEKKRRLDVGRRKGKAKQGSNL